MKTIAIIPARGGSKRLPGKNIKLLGNMPLLAHSILYAKQHNFIDAVYVSTDDSDIKKIALEYGAFVIDRPIVISGDFDPTVLALKHVLEHVSLNIENVVLLQPTNPLRPNDLLTKCFEEFMVSGVDSLFTVSRNHHKLGKIINNKFVPYNYELGQRSQDLEPLFFENGLVYISKANTILQSKIITENAFPYLVSHIFTQVDIDTHEDFEYAEYLLHKFANS